MYEGSESWIIADGVEIGVSLNELQYVRLLLNCLPERSKGLFVITETQVGVYERS